MSADIAQQIDLERRAYCAHPDNESHQRKWLDAVAWLRRHGEGAASVWLIDHLATRANQRAQPVRWESQQVLAIGGFVYDASTGEKLAKIEPPPKFAHKVTSIKGGRK